MHLLLYAFYHSAKNNESPRNSVHRYAQATTEVHASIFALSCTIIMKLLFTTGAIDWLENQWPIDAGRHHSKNFLTPLGIFILTYYAISLWAMRFVLLKKVNFKIAFKKFQQSETHSEARCFKFLSSFLFLAFLLTGIMILIEQWLITAFLTALIVAVEIWVVQRFFKHNPLC